MSPVPGPDAVRHTLSRATPAQVEEGVIWYQTAHAFAAGAADRYGLPADQVAWALAALSPQQSWGANQRSLIHLLDHGSTWGLGANISKAQRILQGEPALGPGGVLNAHPERSGFKVRAFGTLICDPDDPDTVCVDRHAADIALGRPTDASPLPAGFLNAKRYSAISDAYRIAAERTDYTPAQVQAITWLTRRQDKYRKGAFD